MFTFSTTAVTGDLVYINRINHTERLGVCQEFMYFWIVIGVALLPLASKEFLERIRDKLFSHKVSNFWDLKHNTQSELVPKMNALHKIFKHLYFMFTLVCTCNPHSILCYVT